MAEGTAKKAGPWIEVFRYLPYHPRDLDVEAQFPEDPRDADGKVSKLDRKGYEFPDPYVRLQRTNPDEEGGIEHKVVKIPAKAADRVRRALERGEIQPEHLSQLPLGELFPELAEHQGYRSGASRVPWRDDEEGGD